MIDRTTAYAKKVVSGEILASEKNIQTCQRHLDNMELKVFNYHFAVEKAEKVINFIEKLPVPKTMKNMELKQFQCFIIGSLFGWVNSEGERRFTMGYISMSRKQGKTLLVSGIAMHDLLLGSEPEYERVIGVVSKTQSQANLVWTDAKTQLQALRKQSKKVKDTTQIKASIHELLHSSSRSMIKSFSREADNLEGSQISTGIIDEAHLLKDTKVFEGIRRGQTLLNNPSLYYISTAGTDLSVPFYDEYQYITKVLNKEEVNDNYFIFCAEQDSQEEIHDSSTWIKSNPLIEDEEIAKTIIGNLEKEVKTGIAKGEINSLLVKSFNLWRQASKDTYIQKQDWDKGIIDPIDIKGRKVYIGIDLSRQDDLSAIGFIYPLEDKAYYVDSHIFVGFKHDLQEKSQRDKIDYLKLVDNGDATMTNTTSGIINYEQIIDWLAEYIEDNDLKVESILIDPWNAQSFMATMERDHYEIPVMEVEQNYKNLSPALKDFRLKVYDNKIFHNGNPNLNLAIQNAIAKEDNNGNILLDKKMNRQKIDAIVSLTTAFTLAMKHEFDDDFNEFIMSEDFGF